MKDIEKRFYRNQELRAEQIEGKRTITCAIPYNSPSHDMGFIEIIKPSAFSKTIKDRSNVRALYQHNDSVVLGAVKNDTLRLHNTDNALVAEITLPDTQEARDIFTLVRDGYIDQCSFGFSTIKDSWSNDERGKQIRELQEVKLHEISIVTFPAYEFSNATASLRNLSEFDVDTEALLKAVEERDKEKIKSILSPLYTEESQANVEAVEEPAVNDTGADPTLYSYALDVLLM